MNETDLPEKECAVLDYFLRKEKLSIEINSENYSEEIKERLLRSHTGKKDRFKAWYRLNKTYADDLGVSMPDFIAVMQNYNDASNFHWGQHLDYVYQDLIGDYRSQVLLRSQLKKEGKKHE